MFHLRMEGKKVNVSPQVSMIVKRLLSHGIDNAEVRCHLGEMNYIFCKHKGKTHRVGIAKRSKDNKWIVDRLFMKTIYTIR